MSSPAHWDSAFAGDVTARGWYQTCASPSWDVIGELPLSASLLDVGAGASVWVDEALDRGYDDVTVVDWSPVALEVARNRLGSRSDRVHWIRADLLTWQPPRTYDLWHDRAVLHFLLNDADRARYAQALLTATAPGSVVVIGCFGPTGPDMCAGLPVRRQSHEDFEALLGSEFTIEQVIEQVHVRPDADTQDYLWIRAIRTA